MKFNNFLQSMFFITTVMSSVFTMSTAIAKPTCPPAGQIAAEGLQIIDYDNKYNEYIGGTISNFGGTDNWVFIIAIPANQAIDNNDARTKLTTALHTLRGNPKAIARDGHWFCLYNNNYSYMSIAATPVDFFSPTVRQSVMQIKNTK